MTLLYEKSISFGCKYFKTNTQTFKGDIHIFDIFKDDIGFGDFKGSLLYKIFKNILTLTFLKFFESWPYENAMLDYITYTQMQRWNV